MTELETSANHKGFMFVVGVGHLKALRDEDLAALEPHQINKIIAAIEEAQQMIEPLREAIHAQRPIA